MHDILFSLWLALHKDGQPDDDPDDDDDEGGGLPVPVTPVPAPPGRWPPRVRLFLPPALPDLCPVEV